MRNHFQVALLMMSLSLLTFNAHAETVTGYARVVDADTLVVSGQKIRIIGIDAPEKGQTCRSKTDVYQCGEMATSYMRELVAGHKIKCDLKKSRDKYGRRLGVCYQGEYDLGGELVFNGWAMAYYGDYYVGEEAYAKDKQLGIWKWYFFEPESWRKLKSEYNKRK